MSIHDPPINDPRRRAIDRLAPAAAGHVALARPAPPTRPGDLGADLRSCAFDLVAARARIALALGRRLGDAELHRAAEAVLDCLATGDAAALSATVTRLGRLLHRLSAPGG